ncbi:type I restriction endonuclease subunit R, EcoR124 family, partial [Candidatus Phytoplasma meliae]
VTNLLNRFPSPDAASNLKSEEQKRQFKNIFQKVSKQYNIISKESEFFKDEELQNFFSKDNYKNYQNQYKDIKRQIDFNERNIPGDSGSSPTDFGGEVLDGEEVNPIMLEHRIIDADHIEKLLKNKNNYNNPIEIKKISKMIEQKLALDLILEQKHKLESTKEQLDSRKAIKPTDNYIQDRDEFKQRKKEERLLKFESDYGIPKNVCEKWCQDLAKNLNIKSDIDEKLKNSSAAKIVSQRKELIEKETQKSKSTLSIRNELIKEIKNNLQEIVNKYF